ncbi:MAG: FecR domain-containing protein [Candidatus Omnitrophica bacterium]|nr:FecR domain-containing protein [Candidatus Omnitrophota bacterium]
MNRTKLLCAIMAAVFSLCAVCWPADDAIILADKKGKVYFWDYSKKPMPEPPLKSAIAEKTYIATGKDSSAVIAFGKKAVVTLAENTSLQVQRSLFDEKKEIKAVKIDVRMGKIWSIVEKLPAAEAKFEIETPNTLAAVRGTVFTAGYTPANDSTMVGVVSGEVGVASTKIAAYVILKENMSTVVVANEKPVDPRVLEEREKQEWEQWKNSIPFSEIGIVGGIAEINAIQTQEAARIVRELGIAKKGSGKVIKDFEAIEKAITLFYADTRQVPGKLKDLLENPGIEGWEGPYIGAGTTFMDPYGRPYQYRKNLKTPGGREYLELSTFGLIGAAGDEYGKEKKLIFIGDLKKKLQQ